MMFLALFLVALFRVKSVNFSELATGFMGSAKMDSNYKRLQRFFSEFELDYHRDRSTGGSFDGDSPTLGLYRLTGQIAAFPNQGLITMAGFINVPDWVSFENQGADLAHQMNCALYREHHYPIGSGVTKGCDLHPIH